MGSDGKMSMADEASQGHLVTACLRWPAPLPRAAGGLSWDDATPAPVLTLPAPGRHRAGRHSSGRGRAMARGSGRSASALAVTARGERRARLTKPSAGLVLLAEQGDMSHAGSVAGSSPVPKSHTRRRWEQEAAARRAGVTARAIRKAAIEKRLPAQRVAGDMALRRCRYRQMERRGPDDDGQRNRDRWRHHPKRRSGEREVAQATREAFARFVEAVRDDRDLSAEAKRRYLAGR